MPQDLSSLAIEYQQALPSYIRDYLHHRGIPDELVGLHRLGWNGYRIAIPIPNRNGVVTFFKLAKDPADETSSPKMLTGAGGSVELYGWERVAAKPSRLIICEGEFDRLVLEAHGLGAVTSTGGAGGFRAEWADDLMSIPELFICFDRDMAGRTGALRVGQLLPHARIVELPAEVGPGGDVTDYFVHQGRTREDFELLLDGAVPAPTVPSDLPIVQPPMRAASGAFSERIAGIKRNVKIVDVVSSYVALKGSASTLRGHCPFHDDSTPSFVVYPVRGLFRCYGCGKHGDIIEFYGKMEHLPFLRTLDALERWQSDHYGDRPGQRAA